MIAGIGIEGIGTDVLELERIRAILQGKNRARFVERILTPAERKRMQTIYAERRAEEFIAGRFALKEAVAKALGCGIGKKVGFHDIEIKADSSGKPHCTITPSALERLGIQHHILIHISLSHSNTQVVAFAVAEKRAMEST